MIAALAGGVGSARFLRGLLAVVDSGDVTAIVNTGDDDHFHGLLVCPDLDSVTYALAGANNPETGWGLAGETFAALGALERYGVDTWFRLGDRDLATHLFRTQRLAAGATLAEVTAEIAAAWGLECRLLPMTNDPAPTRIVAAMASGGAGLTQAKGPEGPEGVQRPEKPDANLQELAMEEWFVREQCRPPVVEVRLDAAAAALPAPGVLDALRDAETVVVCPANPVLSIAPILAVAGVRAALRAIRSQVVAVSPLIAGSAVKGPADRMFGDLGLESSCVGVARMYRDFCGTFVIDAADAARAAEIEALGMRVCIAETLMVDARVAAALARDTLAAVA